MKKNDAYRSLSDSELVAAVRGGNDRAFDAMFLRWYPQVRKFLIALVKEKTLAEDLAQMVFMKVWLYRDRLNEAQSLKSYLVVLARNAALDVFKSKRHLMMADTEAAPEETAPDRSEQRVEYGEMQSRLRRAVEEMPPQRRQIFKMSRFQSLSNEDIADELGLSVRTVEKHIQLALQDLRKYLS